MRSHATAADAAAFRAVERREFAAEDISAHDLRAVARQRQRDAAPDAVRRACHESLPAGEIEIHVSLHLPRVDAVSTIADSLDLRKQDGLDGVWIGRVAVFDGQDA